VTPGEYKERGRGLTIRYGLADSPFGTIHIGVTDRGVCGLTFAEVLDDRKALGSLRRRWRGARFEHDREAIRRVARRIFDGTDGGPITLELKGTNFQIKVWEALLRIPMGTVVAYGDVAKGIGHPDAQRAVGTAVGQNPIAFLIPCHRVIKSTGAFGNYGGGITRKKAILGWEAARCEASTAA
jgi:AraC family transcriptional regulator of adaptative response/methylated-DNA-[protein]-cysteine methyltransferase